MIELKNISKTYQSKKGGITHALNDVSLKFDSKGMTFILGKSGSGKSTLLNILGGLDQYDSGDMIVFGKSSKNFSSRDFDSYRNTYIGFVFQEYNILEDYNVYENIILALQLQQKKVDEEKIDELLKKLELLDLKKRKVNELSGGQKQRVAIARALIKNPKIILADEPTGNLDSKTSQQVMKLLKEISQEKLVIVVSHDEESATTYGDRIIRIKDGEVEDDTNSDIELVSSSYQVISSKLPWLESLKLGFGSLRHKKIKLVFTIILTVFALLFLSITDTLASYNVNLAHAKLLVDQEEKFVQIQKYRIHKDDYAYREQLILKQDDVNQITKNLKKDYHFIYRLSSDFRYQNIYNVLHISSEYDSYYYGNGSFDMELVEMNSFEDLKNDSLIGNYPTKTDEIIISNVVANLIMEKGITPYQKDTIYFPKNYQELLNCDFDFYFGSAGKVKIVGIIDYDLSSYQEVLNKQKNKKNLTTKENYILIEYYKKLNNIYNKIYAKEGFIKDLKIEDYLPLDQNYSYQVKSSENLIWQEGLYIEPSIIHDSITYFDGKNWVVTSSLKENEILLNVEQLIHFDISDYREKLTNYINQNLGKSQIELEKEFFADYVKNLDIIGHEVDLEIDEYGNSNLDSKTTRTDIKNLKVIGLVGLISDNQEYYYVPSYLSSYQMNPTPMTGVLVYEDNQKDFYHLMNTFSYHDTLSATSTFSDDVNSILQTISVLKKIAFYVAIVFIVFTIILITSFMFSSISYRKKEIGILRGLGAKSSDVMKIFLWEGILLAGISFLLASIILVGVTNLLNSIIMSGMSLILTPFILTPRQFIIILLLVYSIVFIASVLPILKIAKLKPIDAILKR